MGHEELQELLAEWRQVVLRREAAAPGTPEHREAKATADAFRSLYERLASRSASVAAHA